MPSELLSVKIEEFKFNYILNWILIGAQFSATCLSNFLIFMANKLLEPKIEESETN